MRQMEANGNIYESRTPTRTMPSTSTPGSRQERPWPGSFDNLTALLLLLFYSTAHPLPVLNAFQFHWHVQGRAVQKHE